MNRVEGYITAHIGDNINECDDNFSINLSKCSFAVADGSSSDFFSKIYSRLLADTFVEESVSMFEESKIKDINNKWQLLVREKLDNAGCKPGSFPFVRFQKRDPGCSTLIGLKLYKEGDVLKFRCAGLGDSLLFFIPEGSHVPTVQFSSDSNEDFSLDQSVKFGYTPVISTSYSTKWLENIIHYEGVLEKGTFYLMTDGLAEWILRKESGDIAEKFSILNNIKSQDEFASYVNTIRDNGAHNDDMTLVKIYIDDLLLEFSESESIIYDYVPEQTRLDNEEYAKRRSAVTPPAPKPQASTAPPKSNDSTSDLIASALAKVSQQNKEKAEWEEKLRKLKLQFEDEKKRALEELRLTLEAEKEKALNELQAKLEDDKDADLNELQAKLEEEKAKALNELKAKLEEEKEKALNELRLKLEEEKKKALNELRLELEEEKEEALTKIDSDYQKREEEKEKKKREEKERAAEEAKKIKNRIRKHFKDIVILILLLISLFLLVSRNRSVNGSDNEQPEESPKDTLTQPTSFVNVIVDESFVASYSNFKC
jgi:serine/threonine protein phosphatase PrpC